MARAFDKSSRFITLSFFLIFLSLTFCKPNQPPADIRIALPSDPNSLDPLFLTDLTSQKLAKFVHKSIYYRKESDIVSDWVKTEEIKNLKGKTYLILSLKEQSPNLEDIKFSLQRLISETYPRKHDFRFLKKVEITPNKTIQIEIEPKISLKSLKESLSLPFVSVISKEKFLMNGSIEGYGSYQCIEWKKNEFLKLKKRESNKNLPQTIEFLILPQSTTSLFLYRKSKLDGFKLSDFLLSIPEATEDLTLTKKGRSVQYVAINGSNPCLDKNFRIALNLSIPRDLLIEKILEGKADLTYGPVPVPYFLEKFPNQRFTTVPFDLVKAKEYLKQSKCYPKILNKELEFRMKSDDENQTKGRAIVQSLIDLGLKIKLKPLEKAPLYKENGMGLGDLTLLTWYSDYDSIWNFLDPLFHPDKLGNGGNRTFYKNEKLRILFDNKESLSQDQTIDVIRQIEADMPWLFLWSIQENYLVSREFLRYSDLSDYL
ncbi:MAG: ABC transporter substrate-binding protein [Leptospira sp.]|nr:ABC transporter substrate-binding protein [Leptospira sp.]